MIRSLPPRIKAKDAPDVILAHTRVLGKVFDGLACMVPAAYIAHDIPRQLVGMMRLACVVARASSYLPVGNVVLLCARLKVRGVAARRVIATVADYDVGRRGAKRLAVGNLPRYAMGFACFALHRHGAVSAPTSVVSPQPASIRPAALIDFRPEAFLDGLKAAYSVVNDKAHRLALDVARVSVSLSRDGRGLTTAAFAQFRGIEIEGKLDYTIHGIASNQVMPTPRLLAQRGGFLCLHYSTLEARPC